jgi:hypothetical protein
MQLGSRSYITRFFGQLHVPEEPVRLEIDFDDIYRRQRADENQDDDRARAGKAIEFDDGDSARSPTPSLPPTDPWALVTPHGVPHHSSPPTAPPLHDVAKPTVQSPAAQHGGGGGGDVPLQIEVIYGPGGDQLDMRVQQVNVLADNDLTNGNEVSAWPSNPGNDITPTLELAEHQLPGVYADTDTMSPASIVATLTDLGTHSSGTAPDTLQEGRVVDGQAVDLEAALPADPTAALPPIPVDNHENMAVTTTGGNFAGNFGGLANEHGVIGTLVVLGDSYKSDAIVQTNVLVDHSMIEGASPSATIQTGGSAANNVAEFVHTLDENPYTMGLFGGLRWHVDTIEGNYYNISLAVQYNSLSDRDQVSQTATDHYKFIETGNNAQGNELIEYNLDTTHYDLVIVTGNYYAANWIFQTNVLLNSDYVSLHAGPGGAGQETVSTGANWLSNSATLTDYTGASHAMTPEMMAVASALQSGQQTLDPSMGLTVPGNGSEDLSVLFINGDYYDLNVLKQTNVVNDSDTVVQSLANGESGFVQTGANQLTNEAVLINVGPTGGQYVAGTQYSEAVLVQTNIIVQQADGQSQQGAVVVNDPGQLAPEAAAIIQHAAAAPPPPPEQTTAPAPTDQAAHTTPDPLSSVLS